MTDVCFQVELEKAVKEKVMERRNTLFEKTKQEVAKRVKFEDAVSIVVMWYTYVVNKLSLVISHCSTESPLPSHR